jgi:hypothetical protein
LGLCTDSLGLEEEANSRKFPYNRFFLRDPMNEDGEDRCSEPKEKQGIQKGEIHLITVPSTSAAM